MTDQNNTESGPHESTLALARTLQPILVLLGMQSEQLIDRLGEAIGRGIAASLPAPGLDRDRYYNIFEAANQAGFSREQTRAIRKVLEERGAAIGKRGAVAPWQDILRALTEQQNSETDKNSENS